MPDLPSIFQNNLLASLNLLEVKPGLNTLTITAADGRQSMGIGKFKIYWPQK